MIKDTITDEEQISEILCTLCEDYPTLCKKEGASGLFSNERIILVKDKFFQYYRHYSSFQSKKTEALDQKYLKSKVELSKIYQITFLPLSTLKKKSICLTIPSSYIIHKDVNEKQKQNHLVKWTFNFDFNLKEQMQKRKSQIKMRRRKKTTEIIPISQESLNLGILSISKVIVKEEQPSKGKSAEEELDDQIKKLKELKLYMQIKQQREQEEKDREKRFRDTSWKSKKRIQQEQKDVFPLYNHWQAYQKCYEAAMKENSEGIDNKIKLQINLLYEICNFKELSTQIAVRYIDEKLIGWQSEGIKFDEDYTFYKGVWIRLGGKELNQIYLVNYYLNDLLYTIKSHKKNSFRIPIMNFVKYKGFKMLVLSNMPYSQKFQSYKVRAEVDFDIEEYKVIQQSLQFFSNLLGVKNQGYVIDQKRVKSPLGHKVRVFKLQSMLYQGFYENFYYITGIQNIYPVDYNFQIKKKNSQYFLRPQLVMEFRDIMEIFKGQQYSLLTQAFLSSNISQEQKKVADQKVYEISTKFIPSKLDELIKKLNSLELILIDSYSTKQYLSSMGINQRYIGNLYKLCEIPYLQQAFLCEAIARTIKRLYKETTLDLLKNQQFFKRQMLKKKDKENINERVEYHNNLMVKNAIDFLNLVFGNDEQTQQFWAIIIEKVNEVYEIQFTFPLKLKPGFLLHSVLYHCAFSLNFKIDIPLFTAKEPFKMENWRQFVIKSKAFDFPSFEINKIIRQIPFIENQVQGENIKKYLLPLLKIELLFNNSINKDHYEFQVVLSRMNILNKQYQKPVAKVPFHPSELPYYFSNKSQQNFKKALDIMNFSLAKNHPLYVSLYDSYSDLFEPELLKKSSLLVAMQGLGQFHSKTTELFSKYYKQGYKIFQIKASRSKQLQPALIISQKFIQKQKFESCVQFCEEQIKSRGKKQFQNTRQLQVYLKILQNGLQCSVKCKNLKAGEKIAAQISYLHNIYKIKELQKHETLLKNILKIKLSLFDKKLYLYKMVLLVLKIQQDFNDFVSEDEDGLKQKRSPPERQKIMQGMLSEYYLFETYGNWIDYIFKNLVVAYRYFNFLSDLFSNYKYHLQKFNSPQLKIALGYLDLLVRFFGQKLFYDHLYQIY